MNEDKIVKSLYRALFRAAKKFDDRPSSKLFLYRSSKGKKDNGAISPYYSDIIDRVLTNKTMYITNNDESFCHLLKEEFRSVNFESTPRTDAIDVGFSLLRKFTSIWSSYCEIYERNNNKSTEILKSDPISVDVSVEEISQIAPGTVLISHPLIAGPLKRSVILVLEHDSKGTYGLVINRPTFHTLKSAVRNFPNEFTQTFGENKIFYGGKIRRMQYLHDVPECEGTLIPNCLSPLYYGGKVENAVTLVTQDKPNLKRFNFFVGCCIWGPEQLAEEVNHGYWIATKTAPDQLLKLSRGKEGTEEQPSTSTTTSVTSSSSSNTKSRRYRNGRQVDPLQIDLYNVIINSLGDKFKPFAEFPPSVDHRMIESCD